MLCLTDGSDFAGELTDRPEEVVAVESLPPADRELWLLLHGGPQVTVVRPPPPVAFWSRLVLVDRAPHSPFDALAEATAAGFVLPGPVAVVAGTCPQLRGFHGRKWESELGNLHLSAAIPLENWPADGALSLVLVPTLAARDAIVTASAGTVSPRIKWVNDLYIEGGKAGGVLTRTAIEGTRAVLLLVGIGVNVQSAPAIRPTPFVPWAEAAGGVDLDVLLQETLAALERRLKEARASGFREMSDEYRAASNVIGRRVRVYAEAVADHDPPDTWPPPLAAGVVLDIRDDLSLVIAGAPEPVKNGRLAFEADCRAFGLPHL